MNTETKHTPLARLQHHVTGAIERGEKTAIVGKPARFIVTEYRRDLLQQWYVAARPGYRRCADGSFARDGSFAGGPEWTTKREHALEFTSKLAAARVNGKCPSANIETI